MGGLEELFTLLGGPFVLVTIYGWLRLTRGARVMRVDDPEYRVVTTLAAFDALSQRASQIGLSHLADAVLTSRFVETPATTPQAILRPNDPDGAASPEWTLEANRLFGLAAARHARQGVPFIEALLVELQNCEDASVAAKVTGARAHATPFAELEDPVVILHNDDTTTMNAVVDLLMKYAGHTRRTATYFMLTVHYHGEASLPDHRLDSARPLADALELGAYDLKLKRLKISTGSRAA